MVVVGTAMEMAVVTRRGTVMGMEKRTAVGTEKGMAMTAGMGIMEDRDLRFSYLSCIRSYTCAMLNATDD